jgi:hypothetical protein
VWGEVLEAAETQAYKTDTRDIQTDTYQRLKRVDDRDTDRQIPETYRQIPETYRQTHTRVSREWTTGTQTDRYQRHTDRYQRHTDRHIPESQESGRQGYPMVRCVSRFSSPSLECSSCIR